MSFKAYLWDRKLLIAVYLLGVGIASALFMLDKLRYSEQADPGLLYYFIELALVFLAAGLAVDYFRQRAYFRQLDEATRLAPVKLDASTLIKSGVTAEQGAVQKLLDAQYSAYMTEINKYRRQQEQHNHFVMQWVHQMKTPVAVIDLLAQQGSGQSQSDEQLQLLTSLKEETERLNRGLEMMLHTARLDKFELDLHPRRLPVHEMIRTAINAHKRLCIRYSIYPRVVGEAEAETDEKWITFVLNQLINNAIKYSKHKAGNKKLTVTVKPYNANDGEGAGGVMLSVEDEGIGIAPQDLPRVFDPFFTGENGRAVEESTGMGLYLAKRVCNRLGHDLQLVSEHGQGTVATIYFKPKGIHRIEN
ncbi:HAMP domain-containing sensor histidine kinase [Paenibacillus sp. NEAU-GSW1]|uniref:sensor histidine kinase n=1 Tax=Paenibacillus sp. NEAU-GSW1 TaxID=2682486 RepID=UPI0012E17379|nr:sensor histidine kinase [Paenibacillus sp. NEAU-GSW1]MUT68548.1 sensor histidine kinase [Paenibacillus sp. NEAU-GSW1]